MVTANAPAKPVVTVWRPEAVLPLELWDTVVAGRTLFERRADHDFYDALACALPSVDRVALVGGGVDRARATAAFRSSRHHLALVDDDAFFAASAAARELDVVVVDAGQTSVKAVGPRGRVRKERSADARLAALVASAIDEITGAGAEPAMRGAHEGIAIVLALPCEVNEAEARGAWLGPCSYPIAGDASVFVGELASRARTALAEIRIGNDAVLAAYAARRRLALPPRARALVLTIGHGVGAAILDGPAA